MQSNAVYYHAAYIIVAIVYVAYGISLVTRTRAVRTVLAPPDEST